MDEEWYLDVAAKIETISSTFSTSIVDNKPISAGTQLVAEGPSENVTYQSNLFNRSWIVGGGIKYKIGKDFLYADLRYMSGLSNIALTNKIYYQNPDRFP